MGNIVLGKLLRFFLRLGLGLAVFVAILVTIAQILLSDSVSRQLIVRYAPAVIDGNLDMDGVSISLFRHFPRVTADIDHLVVTYPSERFDSVKTLGEQGLLVYAGNSRAGDRDTLASFSRFSASLNVFALARGVLNLKYVQLSRPHVYVHNYADGSSNLDIIKLNLGGDEQPQDDGGTMRLLLRKIDLDQRAVIVYTDQQRALMTTLILNRLGFEGQLNTARLSSSSFSASLDSLRVVGRLDRDTLMFSLNSMMLDGREGDVDIHADAGCFVGTRSFGRIMLPISLDGGLKIEDDDDTLSFDVHDMSLDVASLRLQADLRARLADRIWLDGSVVLPDMGLQRVIDNYLVRITPEAGKIRTDAVLGADFNVNGYYDSASGELPAFDACLRLPRCNISYEGVDLVPSLALDLDVEASQGGKVNASLNEFCIQSPGIDVDLALKATDLLGDIKFDTDVNIAATLDSLGGILDRYDIHLAGELNGGIKGSFSLADFDFKTLGGADVKGRLLARNVHLNAFSDTFKVDIPNCELKAGIMDNPFGNKRTASKIVGLSLDVDSLGLNYAESAMISAGGIKVVASESVKAVKISDTLSYYPLYAKLDIGKLRMRSTDSLALSLTNSRNSFTVFPSKDNGASPVIQLKSDNERLAMFSPMLRTMVSGIAFDTRTRLAEKQSRTAEGGKRRAVRMDSIQRKMIEFDLGDSFRKYYEKWDLDGGISMKRAFVSTPAFPQRTAVTDFKGSFNNDAVSLDTLRITSGASNIAAKGSVSNLRRALLRRGTINLDLGINSDSLELNELFTSYSKGQVNLSNRVSYSSVSDEADIDSPADEMHVDSGAEVSSAGPLLIPSNLNASIRLKGSGVRYSAMVMSDVDALFLVKKRCAQMEHLRAVSNMGSLSGEAFYSARSAKDIVTGFDMDFKDISAGQAISLVPEIDTLMPLLKSFDGLMDCNFAATANVDTAMNVVMPSVNGIVRISGKDLHFNENKQVSRIARMLLVSNPGRVTIDSMTVEGILKDSRVEIFPFVLKVNNWTMAMAGIQNLDQSFNYHVSIIKSPVGLRLGANIQGDDFDRMKVRLGKCQFKDTNVPSFSQVIDTTRVNLVKAIREVFVQGVDRAVKYSREQQELQRARRENSYQSSVALKNLEELSD
ncbi:MAG: hypothetical protein MJY92_07425 [Bacteroidales bacterium]|nr:hypothetical protein [Bacteroidales bacterium]